MVGGRPLRTFLPRGAALYVVLAVVAVVLVIASAMVALTAMNLNLSATYVNGDIALAEAEAGVARLLYSLAENDRFGFNQDDELRGTVSSGIEGTYYCVTFRANRGLPHSVNNLDGSRPAGYGGRTVPGKMVHVFSTGHCRGQYRTIEMLVDRPPFPFALAASGPIDSSPVQVAGTTSDAAYAGGKTARPGHIASNHASSGSPSIRIRRDPSGSTTATHISGFAQACGAILVEQPATVREGLRAFSGPVKLPRIPVSSLDNQGQPGVVELLPESVTNQVLDVMYRCPHDLTCQGSLELKNAFLFVKGNLAIQGGISGVGAIVVDGSLRVEGDTALHAGSDPHQVALVASGDVDLVGTGNYLQGLVYSQGRMSARNLTVLGSMIQNGTSSGTGVSLDQVTVVSSPGGSSLKFTARSSRKASQAAGASDTPYPIGVVNGQPFIGNPGAAIEGATTTYDLAEVGRLNESTVMAMFDGMNVTNVNSTMMCTTSGYDLGDPVLRESYRVFRIKVEEAQALQQEINAVRASLASTEDPGARASLKARLRLLLSQMVPLQKDYDRALKDFAHAYCEYYLAHTDQAGTYNASGDKPLDIARDYDFDLNKFLPAGDLVKVRAWHVHHQRL